MKCVKCDTDNKLKDRKENNGRCKKCRHPFAFDPKITPGVDFTDKFFQGTLASLSVNDSLFFTPRQLYYFFNQRRNNKQIDEMKGAGGCAVFVAVLLTIIIPIASGAFSFVWFIPLLLVAAFGVALLASPDLRRRLRGNKLQKLNVTPEQVDAWYQCWRLINGDVIKLLPAPLPAATGEPQTFHLSPEVRSYSFDRVVICDCAETAQCLIANNFHFEHNCAVLSVDGYPHDIFDVVMEMLRRNPTLSVYALHDASVPGVGLPHTLRTDSRWFAGGNATIYDLGLLPRQIFNRPVFVEKESQRARAATTTIPAHVAATLEPAEVRWLEAGNRVSLESFTPQTLLRVVAQGIAKSRDSQAGDALVPVTTGGDGGGFIYASDSFG